MRSFKFLKAHLTIRTNTCQLGKVQLLMEVEEKEGDNDDAVSLGSACSSSQLPSASHPSMSQPAQVKSMTGGPKAPSTTGKRVNEAIRKLAEHMALNTSVQD